MRGGDLGPLLAIIDAIERWDGDLEVAASIAHAIEGVPLRIEPPGESRLLTHREAGVWMRFEGRLLAMIARLNPADPDERRCAERIDQIRDELRARGPLARAKGLA